MRCDWVADNLDKTVAPAILFSPSALASALTMSTKRREVSLRLSLGMVSAKVMVLITMPMIVIVKLVPTIIVRRRDPAAKIDASLVFKKFTTPMLVLLALVLMMLPLLMPLLLGAFVEV